MSLIVALAGLAAGLVQGMTGFGSGIVLMMVLPFLYDVPRSAAIVGGVLISLNTLMVYTYRKNIKLRNFLFPALLSMVFSSLVIHFSTLADPEFLKKLFGGFLILLSIYYLFIRKNTEMKRLSPLVSVIFIAVSGVCDGLFSIGGPLMVLYFLSNTDSKEEYLGTIQGYFLINCTYCTIFRVFQGILTVDLVPAILCGAAGILVGGLVANRLVQKIDADKLTKLIYVTIGISGIINLF